jgi:hypothetical protein
VVTSPNGQATHCADCSGTPGLTGHICHDCGREDKLYQRDRCAACSLRLRVDTLLGGQDATVSVEFLSIRDAIVASASPRTALNWLRRGAGAPLLAALSRGELACSHTALDAHPQRRGADYLRARCSLPTAHYHSATKRWPASSAQSLTCSPPCHPSRTGAS